MVDVVRPATADGDFARSTSASGPRSTPHSACVERPTPAPSSGIVAGNVTASNLSSTCAGCSGLRAEERTGTAETVADTVAAADESTANDIVALDAQHGEETTGATTTTAADAFKNTQATNSGDVGSECNAGGNNHCPTSKSIEARRGPATEFGTRGKVTVTARNTAEAMPSAGIQPSAKNADGSTKRTVVTHSRGSERAVGRGRRGNAEGDDRTVGRAATTSMAPGMNRPAAAKQPPDIKMVTSKPSHGTNCSQSIPNGDNRSSPDVDTHNSEKEEYSDQFRDRRLLQDSNRRRALLRMLASDEIDPEEDFMYTRSDEFSDGGVSGGFAKCLRAGDGMGASLGEFKASMGLSAKGELFDDLFCRPSCLDEALTTEPGQRTPAQVSNTHTIERSDKV